MRRYKKRIIAGVFIAAILAFAFWYGSGAPKSLGEGPLTEQASGSIENDAPAADTDKAAKDASAKADVTGAETKDEEESCKNTQSEAFGKEEGPSSENETNKDTSLKQGKQPEGSATEERKDSTETESAAEPEKELKCTLSIRCDTILKNIAMFNKEKIGLVPEDGVIFKERTVVFYEGESVFDLLKRETKQNKIHMEFENTPVYDSAYVEGIANIYEFDCGELSGWMYRVNGQFPNYGCSRYQLKEGDRVEWVYTCDLGADVGDNYFKESGR